MESTREQFPADERAFMVHLDATELVALVPTAGPLLLTTLLTPAPDNSDWSDKKSSVLTGLAKTGGFFWVGKEACFFSRFCSQHFDTKKMYFINITEI